MDASPEHELPVRRRNAINAVNVFIFPNGTPRRLGEDGLDADHAPAGIASRQERPGAGLLDAWASSPGGVYHGHRFRETHQAS
jgi:hypothetical protein